ncbi:sce7726 family protein [Pseudomonas sp. NPDC089758]|uniref:sce7726 family protein n=1 Tax=Pseudomonas sp. NPDC089758 TaxID=3364473 RepID=UPI00380ED834
MIFDINTHRSFSKILSRSKFLSLAKGSHPADIFKDIKDFVPADVTTVSDLYEFAFKLTKKAYRNEYIYKTAIANRVVFGRHSPKTSSIAVELPIEDSVVDLAIFNGTSTAYEIKTELDSPRRLTTQTPNYLKAFDNIYIVTAPRLAATYEKACPKEIGIITLTSRDCLSIVRPAQSNKANINPATIFKTLRRDEYVTALEEILKTKISLPNGIIRQHCEKVFCTLDPTQAHEIFVNSMRLRTTSIESASFLLRLPEHLRILGYASSLSRPQRERLLIALEKNLH